MIYNRQDYLKNIKRVVIKVGSSSITHSNGLINLNKMEHLCQQIADIHNKGIEIVFVSSGAIGAGMGKLMLKERPRTIPEKQAAAAVGQGILIHLYEKMFSEYGITIAQILLTREDMGSKNRYLNGRFALSALIEKNVIPIINENDAISVEEIKFGDNDNLSALVACMVEADLLIILSDIDGLYDKNPSLCSDASIINFVDKIDKSIEEFAGGTISNVGTGGMITKIKAARVSTSSGIPMVIAKSDEPYVLDKILSFSDLGTFFKPKIIPLKKEKRWIAFASKVTGSITVDDGAENALIKHHKSLLPSGILNISGSFSHRDVVNIMDIKNKIIARGITNYSSSDLEKIKGIKTGDIEKVLGIKNYDEVIHCDNMVII
ncbi:MAG: glutamate 5-kinase [Bacillota bacterium]|nr:glutamate 5-kinase [Bacillota bacterium]